MRLFLLSTEETDSSPYPLMCADGEEELANLILKKNEEGNGTDADNTIEECAKKAHLQDLGDEEPKDDEHEDTEEDVQ